jgi:hypothetical protein
MVKPFATEDELNKAQEAAVYGGMIGMDCMLFSRRHCRPKCANLVRLPLATVAGFGKHFTLSTATITLAHYTGISLVLRRLECFLKKQRLNRCSYSRVEKFSFAPRAVPAFRNVTLPGKVFLGVAWTIAGSYVNAERALLDYQDRVRFQPK